MIKAITWLFWWLFNDPNPVYQFPLVMGLVFLVGVGGFVRLLWGRLEKSSPFLMALSLFTFVALVLWGCVLAARLDFPAPD